MRAFPSVPMVWSLPNGTLSPEARRFLQSLFTQLGGNSPIDIGQFSDFIALEEGTIFIVAALPE